MNDALIDLYEKYWESFITNVYKPYIGRCAYPFLIQVPQQYIEANKRVMICGQETQGWGKRNPDTTSVQDIQQMYYKFMDNNIWHNSKYDVKITNSPYWNFNRRLSKSNLDVGFIFQNVVKVGKYDKAGCDNKIYELSKQYFPVWMEELKILKPDLIIFLTGTYDWRIKEEIGTFNKVPIREDLLLDELRFDNPLMPKAYRTNHPRFLQANKRYYQTADIISDFIKEL